MCSPTTLIRDHFFISPFFPPMSGYLPALSLDGRKKNKKPHQHTHTHFFQRGAETRKNEDMVQQCSHTDVFPNTPKSLAQEEARCCDLCFPLTNGLYRGFQCVVAMAMVTSILNTGACLETRCASSGRESFSKRCRR